MLELTGPMHLGVVYGVVRFELEDVSKGTRLRFSHRGIGEVTAVDVARFRSGWTELLTIRLVALVEKGKASGIAATSRRRGTRVRKKEKST
jgi:Activator of Hsp90 ATPase homolog 1-like protein